MFRREFGLSMAEKDLLPWYESRLLIEEYVDEKTREEEAYRDSAENGYDSYLSAVPDLRDQGSRNRQQVVRGMPASFNYADTETIEGIGERYGITVRTIEA